MDIGSVGDIISAACLIHNYIIDARDPENETFAADFDYTMVHDNGTNGRPHPSTEPPLLLVTDNDALQPAGRHSNSDVASRKKGMLTRDALCYRLDGAGLTRPKQTGMKYNHLGMVYMDR